MLTRREDLTPPQLRVIEAIEDKGGRTVDTSLPPLTEDEADIMIKAIKTAKPLSMEDLKRKESLSDTP